LRPATVGFSLIEITLALLVFAVGILALLSLFPAGVKLSNDSYLQTRIAAFAELALNSVEAQLYADEAYDKNVWSNRTLEFTAPSLAVWQDPSGMRLVANSSTGTCTIAYRLAVPGAADVEDCVFRYRLTVKGSGIQLYDRKYRMFCVPQSWTLRTTPFGRPGPSTTNKYDLAVMDAPTLEWVSTPYLVEADIAIVPGRYGNFDSKDTQRHYFRRRIYLFHPTNHE
jgi:type II secretory pathway pseudopilin PulG